MNERQMQFRVGVAVFAAVILGGLLATLNEPLPTGWLPWGRLTYQVGIEVSEAPGVGLNTPVRKNGVLIGRIKSIDDRTIGVMLRAEIDSHRELYAEYEPHIHTTVLGDATIDFESRPPAPGSKPVTDGAVFRGTVDPNPFDSISKLGDLQDDIEKTMDALARAGDEVAQLADRVNTAFGDETEVGRVTRLLDTTERAMSQFAQTMSSVNEIIGDVPGAVGPAPMDQLPRDGQLPPGTQQATEGQQMRRRIRQGLNELPDAVRDMRVTMGDFRDVLQSAEKNFKNLEGLTEPLGETGPEFVEAIMKVVAGLDSLVVDFKTLTQALNNREGTIGRLIHDPQVHDNFNRLMCNANTVLGDVQNAVNDISFRLKPILNDARIFMYKIAQEPGRLVTGGLKPSVVK